MNEAFVAACRFEHEEVASLLLNDVSCWIPSSAGVSTKAWAAPRARGHLRWDPPTQQQVLDTALAVSVVNGHFDVADFLLQHGANINTNWNSHEPASILHHLVFLRRSYESMQFLIDRGIDMIIEDYRWNSTAQGWAMHALQDERMAQWLDDAERRRPR